MTKVSTNLTYVICGGRNFDDYDYVKEQMAKVYIAKGKQPFLIVSGGNNGADGLAKRYAEDHNINYKQVPANWKKHGRAAGPIRNSEMLEKYKPDLVIAFPGGKGTMDTVRKAYSKGIEVFQLTKKDYDETA